MNYYKKVNWKSSYEFVYFYINGYNDDTILFLLHQRRFTNYDILCIHDNMDFDIIFQLSGFNKNRENKIMNTHETYVSFETAKLLKKAGFDWEVNTCRYNSSPDKVSNYGTLTSNFNGYAFQNIAISAPTLEVAQRWLREVKNIDVVVSRAMQWRQFYYTITHEDNKTSKIDFMSLNEDLWWFKYEEALEAGIKKALELILENGE